MTGKILNQDQGLINTKSITDNFTNNLTDTWIKASWEEFVTIAEDPSLLKGRCYYDHSLMRIEMTPIGPTHAHEDAIVSKSIGVMTGIICQKFLPLRSLMNVAVELGNHKYCRV